MPYCDRLGTWQRVGIFYFVHRYFLRGSLFKFEDGFNFGEFFTGPSEDTITSKAFFSLASDSLISKSKQTTEKTILNKSLDFYILVLLTFCLF